MARSAGEPGPFRGWSPDALLFFEALSADNSKAFWSAHRERYEREVRAPMLALVAAVADAYGTFHLFRPHRDVRFSKDKSPYKTHLGAVTEGEGGELYYVQLSGEGLMAASGYYQMAADQLERYREAVVDERTGPELEAIVAALERDGYTIGAHSELKTAPRGYRRDHPRIVLLRRKGCIASRSFAPAKWLATSGALGRVTGTWDAASELNGWLNAHVGPSTAPPEDAW